MQHFLTVRAGIQGIALLGGGALAGGVAYSSYSQNTKWGAVSGAISGLSILIFTNHPKLNKTAWAYNLGVIIIKCISIENMRAVSEAETRILVIQFIAGLMVSQLNPGA